MEAIDCHGGVVYNLKVLLSCHCVPDWYNNAKLAAEAPFKLTMY